MANFACHLFQNSPIKHLRQPNKHVHKVKLLSFGPTAICKVKLGNIVVMYSRGNSRGEALARRMRLLGPMIIQNCCYYICTTCFYRRCMMYMV